MKRRYFIKNIGIYATGSLMAGSILSSCKESKNQSEHEKPNFIILFADDMGYGDWNRGGHPTILTPNLNRMADEGVQFTQFYSGNPVCSPSRSALLTGRNNIRSGIIHVFFPGEKRGLPVGEITIAEVLKPLGYATACIGKWHLGDQPEFMPTNRGFDYYYGIPYSNDMRIKRDDKVGPPLMRNLDIIEHPADQASLTKRYTEEAIKFIERSKERPFSLYLPYTMPHRPLFASKKFLNTSLRGLYGDTIEEIDWSVGEIISALDRLNLSKNTLIIFTSDNGHWHIMKQHGGSAGLLRGAKGDTWEGGMRVPFIARWPERIPGGIISSAVGSVLDFFPTCVLLAGGKVPEGRPIDGINLMPALEGKEMPERTIYYYYYEELRAVRKGKWKLHFSYYDHSRGGYDKKINWIKPKTPLLYNLEVDPSEKYDIAEKHPDIVKDLTRTAENYKKEIRRNNENQDLVNWFFRENKAVRVWLGKDHY